MLQVGDLLCSAWVGIWIHETHDVILAKISMRYVKGTPTGASWSIPARAAGPHAAPITRSRSYAIPVRFLLDSSVFFYFWLHAQEHQQQHQLLLQHPIRGPIPGPPPLFRAPLLSALIFFQTKVQILHYSLDGPVRLLTWPVEEYLSCAKSRLILRLPSRFLYF